MSAVRQLCTARIVRFGVAAGVCTLLQLGLMLVLVAQGVDDLIANGVGFVVSAQVNFVLSIVFTYRDRVITWSSAIIVTRWIPFNATALCALAVNEVAFTLCVRQHFAHVVASLCGTLCGSMISFFIGNKAIFSSEGNIAMNGTLAQNELHAAVITRLKQEGIAFFLPAYNEAKNLPTTVRKIFNFFAAVGCRFTIIIVDDGSTDNTPEVTAKLQETYGSYLSVIRHNPNKGYGGALRTGISTALETTHGLIGFCDSDGQFDIADSNSLIQRLIEDDADLAIGIRTLRADSLKRRLMGRGWHKLSQLLLGYKAADVDCGFKVFGRHVLEKISPQLCGDHAVVSPELLIRAQRAGFRTVETSVRHLERTAGEQTGANLRVVWRSLVQVFQLRRLINQEG